MTNKELFNFIKNKRGSISRDNCNRIINRSIQTITVPQMSRVGAHAFRSCIRLTTVTLPNGMETINSYAFQGCSALTTINFPASLSEIADNAFSSCTSLENVTIENGFVCNGLNLSASTKFSVDTMIAMFNALADRTGLSAYTLTLGNTNLAKLSNEQLAIATEKNWTLA